MQFEKSVDLEYTTQKSCFICIPVWSIFLIVDIMNILMFVRNLKDILDFLKTSFSVLTQHKSL